MVSRTSTVGVEGWWVVSQVSCACRIGCLPVGCRGAGVDGVGCADWGGVICERIICERISCEKGLVD